MTVSSLNLSIEKKKKPLRIRMVIFILYLVSPDTFIKIMCYDRNQETISISKTETLFSWKEKHSNDKRSDVLCAQSS